MIYWSWLKSKLSLLLVGTCTWPGLEPNLKFLSEGGEHWVERVVKFAVEGRSTFDEDSRVSSKVSFW